jgi:hypothetical protein
MAAPSEYCEIADLYDHGLPRGALPNEGRLVADVSAASEIMSLDGHGFRADAELLFRAEAGGTLPAPLAAGTTYYAIPLTADTFQVSATAGGAAINLTTAGSNVFVHTPLSFAATIRWASALVDGMLPAHVVPLDEVPEIVKSVTAMLAAAKLLTQTGGAGEGAIAAGMAFAKKSIDGWVKAQPIRGATVPRAANLAVAGSLTSADPRGWAPDPTRIP